MTKNLFGFIKLARFEKKFSDLQHSLMDTQVAENFTLKVSEH